MKITLAWKDARLAWKSLIPCALILVTLPLVFEISKIQIWLVAGFLLIINSTALFRMQELDMQDFFLYFEPISRARILASKLFWVMVSTLAIMILCVVAWHTIDFQHGKTPWPPGETPFSPYGLLPVLFLPALAPPVMILYFRSSHITAAFLSCIATFAWAFVAILMCPFIRFSLLAEEGGRFPVGFSGWPEFVGMLVALVACNFYLFCRTDITEKSLGRSAWLGLEFMIVSAWLVYFIGGTNLWDLWYILFG
jgi:hypothetical protein